MANRVIRRSCNTPCEVIRSTRESDGKPSLKLVGYIAKFNSPSHEMTDPVISDKPFVEVLKPGCFDKALKSNPDILACRQHDIHTTFARTGKGTLILKVDDIGLWGEADLADCEDSRTHLAKVEHGDFGGNSFGCFLSDQSCHWEETEDGKPLNVITEVEWLEEVSLGVTFPAFKGTTLETRAKETPKPKKNKRDVAILQMKIANVKNWLYLNS